MRSVGLLKGRLLRWGLALLAVAGLGANFAWGETTLTETERGVVLETDAIKMTVRDGVIVGFVNKYTAEAYVDSRSNTDELLKALPAGMGTQARDAEREAAFDLFHWPWWEHSVDSRWPNQHHPSSKSVFTYSSEAPGSAVLTYSGLTDGTADYKDEVYILNIVVEENGDVAITPEARSPRGGVYGVNLTVAPLMPAITVEAPVHNGITITRDMKPMLWNALWANYWDYAFVALNGWKQGAIGIWCPDAELKYSKTLYHMVNDQGLSLSFHGMNIPPFETLKAAKPVTWKVQAFKTGWSEAAAHFRDWRLANITYAPRAEWTKHISFVNMGVNAGKMWADLMSDYFEGKHLERALTMAPVIREEDFDRNHANNMYYKNFPEEMKYWKEKGTKLMAYLNPVIMWGARPKNAREELGVKMAAEAMTIMPFQGKGAKPVPYVDVQHLGHPGWQRWFLDWVKEYCDAGGANGIYHDEGQKTPLDNNGLVNGMTPTQGRADYHYKAQTENPNTIHGAEHGTAVNTVGISTSIGGGILWGTAQSMRNQRINHASSVSSSLHYPNSVIRAFPHYSEFHGKGSPELFHWGMNQQECRSEIAGHSIQSSALFKGPFNHWVNELWIERTRATIFVWEGLRPYFPADWEKGVVSYFHAADGGEFRYVARDWGTAFVEIEKDGSERMIYARLHGTIAANIGKEGSISGWPMYNEGGPAGLNPTRYYCFDPTRKRPETYFRTNNDFSTGLYEGFVNEGFVSETCAYLDLQAIPELGNIISGDNVVLVSKTEPVAIWVNGAPVKVQKRVVSQKTVQDKEGKNKQEVTYAENEYKIDFRLPAQISVLLKKPASVDEAEKSVFARYSTARGPERRPIFEDGAITVAPAAQAKQASSPRSLVCKKQEPDVAGGHYVLAVPVTLPAGATSGRMVMTVRTSGNQGGFWNVRVNGGERRDGIVNLPKNSYQLVVELPLSSATPHAMLQFEAERSPTMSLVWQEDEPVVEAAGADAAKGKK